MSISHRMLRTLTLPGLGILPRDHLCRSRYKGRGLVATVNDCAHNFKDSSSEGGQVYFTPRVKSWQVGLAFD